MGVVVAQMKALEAIDKPAVEEVYICMHVCACVCLFVCVCQSEYMQIHACIHAYMHTYIHSAYMHMHGHACITKPWTCMHHKARVNKCALNASIRAAAYVQHQPQPLN